MLEWLLVKQEGLGLIPAQTKLFFFSLLRYKEVRNMDPDTINCVILRIHVDKIEFLAAPSSGELV